MNFKYLNIFVSFLVILFLNSCSGPVRYITKDNEKNYSTRKVDSLRIAQKLREVIDTSEFDRNDLEFTEDELEEEKLAKETSVNISLDEFMKKYKPDSINSLPTIQERLIMSIISYIGTPYKYGGVSRKGIDCSAFTMTAYSEAYAMELPRSSVGQYKIGDYVEEVSDLQFGDLVFFNTRRRQIPGHVGIYLWDNLFAHASSSNGVVISSLGEGYYNKRYISARRVLNGND